MVGSILAWRSGAGLGGGRGDAEVASGTGGLGCAADLEDALGYRARGGTV